MHVLVKISNNSVPIVLDSGSGPEETEPGRLRLERPHEYAPAIAALLDDQRHYTELEQCPLETGRMDASLPTLR